MRLVFRSCLAVFAIFIATVTAQQTNKFDIYGFVDGKITKLFFANDQNWFIAQGLSDDLTMTFDHANVYFDMRPNPALRSLVEIGFRQHPYDSEYAAVVGQRLKVVGYNMTLIDTNTVEARLAKSNISMNTSVLQFFEWGSFSLDRAWMEYQINQYANLRFGKFITPAGIWNVDHGSPVITTVRQPYETTLIPLFPVGQVGLMENGRIFAGDAELAYELYVSTGRDQIAIDEITDLAAGGHCALTLDFLNGSSIGISGFTGKQKKELTTQNMTIDISTELYQFAMEAIAQTGILDPYDPANQAVVQQKLGTWMDTSTVAATRFMDPANTEYTTTTQIKCRENVFGADLRIPVGNFTLQSEINYQMVDNALQNEAVSHLLGFYFLGTYKFRPLKTLTISPYIMYERVSISDVDNNPQLFLSGESLNAPEGFIKAFQTTFGGLNCKIHTNLTVKFEYSFADVIMTGIAKDYQDVMDVGVFYTQFSLAF
jgi:hypothetical protein